MRRVPLSEQMEWIMNLEDVSEASKLYADGGGDPAAETVDPAAPERQDEGEIEGDQSSSPETEEAGAETELVTEEEPIPPGEDLDDESSEKAEQEEIQEEEPVVQKEEAQLDESTPSTDDLQETDEG